MNANKNFTQGCQAVATRIVNAYPWFIELIMERADCTNEQAAKVFVAYKKAKVIKLDAMHGKYEFKHGAFLDKDVIWNAING